MTHERRAVLWAVLGLVLVLAATPASAAIGGGWGILVGVVLLVLGLITVQLTQ